MVAAPPVAAPPGPLPAFVLFLLVNAVLLIRPAEILPQLEGIELYFYMIAACALIAATDVLKYLTTTPLDEQPITLCVVAVCVIALLPHLVVLHLEDAWKTGYHFFKNIVYFFLFLAVVTTPQRLRMFTSALLLIGTVSVTVAVLEYHQILTLPTIKAVRDTEVGTWGEVAAFERLQLSGIFKDPNDLCVWLAALRAAGAVSRGPGAPGLGRRAWAWARCCCSATRFTSPGRAAASWRCSPDSA